MNKLYFPIALALISSSLSAQTTARLPLVEGLSSNTCGPCASFNAVYTPIINANKPNDDIDPGIAILKYQMDWPAPGTDPSFNPDGNTRQGFYSTSGIPDWYIDGVPNNGTQAEIDNAQAVPAQLSITAAYTLTGTTVDVTVQIVPLVYLGAGNRCYIGLANKQYNLNTGTNGETQFHHVMRKMLPNGAGTYLPVLNANDTITITESYTYTVGTPVQGDYVFWNSTIEVVAWVQKTTGAKDVRNATVAGQGALGIEEGDKDEFAMIVYPNPAEDQTILVFDADANVETAIIIYNSLGEMVYNESHGKLAGRQQLSLNTSDLANGLYYLSVRKGEQKATSSLVIAR